MAGYRPAVHVVQLKPVSVPKLLQDGEKFIKWEEDSTTGVPVTLKVDPNGFYLYIVDQNKEVEVLDIMSIRDTRTGRYAKLPKDQKMRDLVNIGSGTLEEKTITVCHGPDVVNVNFVNFCCTKPETAKVWTDELLNMAYNMLSLHACVTVQLQKAHTRILLEVDRSGRIPIKTVVKSFASNKDDRKRVEKALEASGLPAGKNDTVDPAKFTLRHFMSFYMHLTGRQEVERIFDQLCSNAKKKGFMTVEQVVDFLNKEQRDPRLNEILYPYADPPKARELIAQYEPNKANIQKGLLSLEGFMQYLMSDDNAIVPPEKFDLRDDMDQPLSHYFINSSHNTYLTGHQLRGKASVEIYRQCLLTGCRCVELDFWNGSGRTEEPIVCHGYTMVTEIPAKDVIEAIAESAFKTSEWPVILSFENHCNNKQQAKIAQYCRDSFGDMLLDKPLDQFPLEPNTALPPPTALRRKILIKNKKKHHKVKVVAKHSTAAANESTFYDVSEPPSDTGKEVHSNGELSPAASGGGGGGGGAPAPPAATSVPKQLSCDSPESEDDEAGSSSDEDDTALSPEERRLRERTQKETGTAGKESEAGAEISALVNYVQPSHFHSFPEAERRNRSYEMSSLVETQATTLLKSFPVEFVNYNKRQLSRVYPRGTRVDSSNFMPQVFWNAGCQLVALNFQSLDLAMQLNMGIFEYNNRSGYLLKPDFMRRPDRRFDPFAESTVDGIIAGTVSVKVISGQFLSEKRCGVWAEVDMYGLPADTVRRRFRTRCIQNNAINPVWDDETFVFKKVVLPDLAVIRIAAYEDSGKLLGHRVMPVVGLRPGYRHISLRNESGQPQGLATLFVKVTVGDYVPDGLSDFAEALANPIKYQSELEKRAQQLRVYTDETEDGEVCEEGGDGDVPSPGGTPQNGGDRLPPPGPDPEGAAAPDAADESGNGWPAAPPPPVDLVTSHRRHDSTKHSHQIAQEDISIPESLMEPESLDTLWDDKAVRERRLEFDRKLEALRRKYSKERARLLEPGQPTPPDRKNTFARKTHSKLVKKFSNKTIEPVSLTVPESTDPETLDTFCRQLAAAERDLTERYAEAIHDALDRAVRSSQALQLKKVQAYHDRMVAESKKRIQVDLKENNKVLVKKSVSKDEMDRLRREMSNVIVNAGVRHRERLKDTLSKALETLTQQHEQVRQQATTRRTAARQQAAEVEPTRLAELRREWRLTAPDAPL